MTWNDPDRYHLRSLPGRCPACGYALTTIRMHLPNCPLGPNASFTATPTGIRPNSKRPPRKERTP